MTDSLKLEQATMVYGPYDLPHMYEIFEGVVYDGCYFFYLENGALCLRHVQKVEQPYHTHLYVEGECGGLQLARGVQREITELSRGHHPELEEIRADWLFYSMNYFVCRRGEIWN
ncbi:UNVERIFIED_CONTAM: hypothetical protein ABIC26_000524 [Paenibacillus sp. PvR008]